MDGESNRSEKPEDFRSGFVAIVGAPNVGKSTLLNQLLEEKVAIATPKPQTTRRQIRGILTGDNFQIVFVDTPGFHESKKLLNKMLIRWTMQALEDIDVVLFVVDVTRRNRPQEMAILDLLRQAGRPVILILNKIDRVAKANILPMIDDLKNAYPFDALIPVSALYRDGIDRVLEETLRLLPQGPQYYDGTVRTDQSREDVAAELIREKVFLLAEQEVPYSTAVNINSLEYDKNKNLIRIDATIFVERPSQKGIIIGKGGKFIKKIGRLARKELEEIWGHKVFISLWVKVLKDWSRDEKALKKLGLAT